MHLLSLASCLLRADRGLRDAALFLTLYLHFPSLLCWFLLFARPLWMGSVITGPFLFSALPHSLSSITTYMLRPPQCQLPARTLSSPRETIGVSSLTYSSTTVVNAKPLLPRAVPQPLILHLSSLHPIPQQILVALCTISRLHLLLPSSVLPPGSSHLLLSLGFIPRAF